MKTLATLVQHARDTGDWNALVDLAPYVKNLGVRVEPREGLLLTRLPFADFLVGNPTLPALHGGALAALLECAAQFEALYRAQTVVLPKTITLTIDYLRSGKPVDTNARAEIIKQGRRVCTVRATAWQDDEQKPIVTATVHLLLMGETPA